MRKLLTIIVSLVILAACQQAATHEPTADTTVVEAPREDPPAKPKVLVTKDSSGKVYQNKRFRHVTATKVGPHRYRISGKAQVFEAAFSWVIEDGHNELMEGHEMTDAGAPEWGNFSFTVDVSKIFPANSTLHIILYEASAKDGSRQFELPVALVSPIDDN